MPTEIIVDPRFNGPPGSANGGYVCGLVAGLLGAPAAEVTLRSPPPLGRPLRWDGERLWDGETLIAEGRGAPLELDVPEPLLGRLHGRVDRAPIAGERCIVIGWPLGWDGRKGYAGTALWSADQGELLASARATWIAPSA